MPQARFETTNHASEWPQTHALDRAATGVGKIPLFDFMKLRSFKSGKELNTPTKINMYATLMTKYYNIFENF